MVKIIGVDFSGGDEKREVNTWITEAILQDSELVIKCCRPTPRAELENILKDLPSDAVAAMDFPFSVPKAFADYWKPEAKGMPDLWRAAAATSWNDFESKCSNYANGQKSGNKHPLRIGDLHSNEPISCLNRRIMPMTFHGMKMLHQLWESKHGFRVPPLHASKHSGPMLLEVMPGAALEAFCLPSDLYKNSIRDEDKLKKIAENRKKILRGLSDRSNVEITNLDRFRGTYLSHHDGLDSLVAAVVAAQWAAKRYFRCPSCTPTIVTSKNKKRAARASKDALNMPQVQAAQLEGWIYVPKPACN